MIISKIKKFILVLLAIGFFFSLIHNIIYTSSRGGLFGIGLPSPSAHYIGKTFKISFDYPDPWVPVETPMGNHGDLDIALVVNSPGHLFPNITIAKHTMPASNIKDVVSWALSRVNKLPGVENSFIESFQTASISGKYLSSVYKSKLWQTNEGDVLCKIYIFYKNSTSFLLTFCSEPKDWELFDPVREIFINSLLIQ
jgi:hypothetical protein